MKKEEAVRGYVAFTSDERMLNKYWSGGGQTGSWKYSLTEDIEKATIVKNKKDLKLSCKEYNACHKNQVEFLIEQIVFTRTVELKKINIKIKEEKMLYV